MSLTLLFLAFLVVAAAWLQKRSTDATPMQLGSQISLAGHPGCWPRQVTDRECVRFATSSMWQLLAVPGPIWTLLLPRRLGGAPTSMVVGRHIGNSTRRWLLMRTASPLVATVALKELLRLKTPPIGVGFDLERLSLCPLSETSQDNTL